MSHIVDNKELGANRHNSSGVLCVLILIFTVTLVIFFHTNLDLFYSNASADQSVPIIKNPKLAIAQIANHSSSASAGQSNPIIPKLDVEQIGNYSSNASAGQSNPIIPKLEVEQIGNYSSNASAGQSNPIIKDPDLRVEQLGKGFPSSPTSMDFIDKDNFLVLVKDGSVYLVSNGTLHQEPVLTLTTDITVERGLLGIAINKYNKSRSNGYNDDVTHPSNKSKNVDVLIYVTAYNERKELKNMLYKYQWNGTKLINPITILELPALPGPHHNGGKLAFGPDNYLYVVIGDLAHTGELQNIKNGSAPDDTGSVLRINSTDGSAAKNNPFLKNDNSSSNNPAAKVFGYGIRNSFGEALDPVTGHLWITDNGPLDYDEINLVKPGFNGGWMVFNGPILRSPATINDLVNIPGSAYSEPVFSWRRTIGVTALDFASPVLGKKYANNIFVGDFNSGNLYYFVVNANRSGLNFANEGGLSDLVADNPKEVAYNIFGTKFGSISEIKTGPDGFLYVLDFLYDRIFRIVPNG